MITHKNEQGRVGSILSVHWGFSLGGVAKYATLLEEVGEYASVKVKTVCILPENRVRDEDTLKRLDAYIISVRAVWDLSWLAKVKGIIREEVPDCIMSHGFNGHLVSLVGRWLSGVPATLIASYHGEYHATTRTRKLVEPVFNGFTEWYMRSKADSIVSVAHYCGEYLQRRGVNAEKITVIHNGIQDIPLTGASRGEVRREWCAGEADILIGVASRLDPVKGINYLIDAFSMLSSRYQRIRLVLIGDGEMRGELEAQVGRLGIADRVLFAGMRSDVPRCLTALDVFALPSLAEYHSIGLLEAMRAGKPIVATDVGGNTESVQNGEEALIVSPASADSLAEALERLLCDGKLAFKLAHAARARFLAEFTVEMMVSRTADWVSSRCCPGTS